MSDTATLNGKRIPVRDGETILAAARRSGVRIPTLCHDPRLPATASCRLCVVKVEGTGRPVAACAQALRPGMAVTTHDDALEAWRRTLLALVLSENPAGDCPRCAGLGPCELHALAAEYGVAAETFPGKTSGTPCPDENPFILRNTDQCIACYRCTQVCNEVEQAHAIVPLGRGFATRIATPFDTGLLASSCTFCGQCVQTCPTGALMDRKMAGQAPAAEVSTVRTICPFCGTGCGIALHVADNRVIGVTPDRTAPANDGALCVKGQFGMDFLHHRDRLTTPLIRRNGRLEEASWEEALDLIGDRFTRIKEESGPGAFACWASSRGTSEGNYLFQKFARAVIGTNNVDNCART